MTGPELAKYVGVTYRQIYHWTARGYLGNLPKTGSGHDMHYPLRAVRRARVLAAAVSAGLTVSRAVQEMDASPLFGGAGSGGSETGVTAFSWTAQSRGATVRVEVEV